MSPSQNHEYEAWINGYVDNQRKKDENRKKMLSDILVIPKKIDEYSRKGFPLAFMLFLCLYTLNVTLARKKI